MNAQSPFNRKQVIIFVAVAIIAVVITLGIVLSLLPAPPEPALLLL